MKIHRQHCALCFLIVKIPWGYGALEVTFFFHARFFLKPLFDLFLTMLSRSRFNCCWFKTKIFILKSRREDCQKKLLEPNLACSTYFAQQGQKLFELSFKLLLMNSWDDVWFFDRKLQHCVPRKSFVLSTVNSENPKSWLGITYISIYL